MMRVHLKFSQQRAGYIMPAVLLFLMLAFAAAALMFRTSSTMIRVEQARVLRASRTQWCAPAMSNAMRLLQTGNPPISPYVCKTTITKDDESKYFLLTFTEIDATNWNVTCTPTTLNDITPDAPDTFTVAPAAPTGLAATTASSDQINLAWDDVAYDKGYFIERSDDGINGWTQIGATAKNVTVYASIGLTHDTNYYYRVRATNSAGEGPYSDVASGKTENIPPLAPSGLVAMAISDSQIDLSWNDVAGETGFIVQRSPNGINSWTQIGTTTSGGTTFSDTGLAATTAYYYRVCGTNEMGDGAFSDLATATTLPTPPAQPSGLAATAASSSQINITWTDVADETGYELERSPDGANNWTQIAEPSADAIAFQDTGLSETTTYYYRLRATNTGGASAYSSVISATTLLNPPTAPTGLGATGASTSQISLTWNDVATESGYKIERSLDNSTWNQIATVAADVTSYASTGLVSNTMYYYRIRATNSAGDSGYSDVASATTHMFPPSAPTGLAADAASTTQINLAWSDVQGESGYLIERSPDNSTWTQIASTAVDVVAYSSMGLSANTTYYFRVRATNAGGNSSYSSTASTSTLPNPPSTPTGLTATGASSSQINLSWSDVTGETGYRVERSLNGTSGWTEIATPAANATSYSNTGLAAVVTYYYRIRATNTGGTSAYSSTASAATLSTAPAAPSGLIATTADTTSIKLDWTDNSNNETGFVIERSPNGTGWSEVATTSADATTYTVTGLTSGKEYFFRIRATNAIGNSSNSGTVSATAQ